MITYYTDGSASPNPGPGGYSVIQDGKPVALGGDTIPGNTTNIRMEGFAIIAALKHSAGEPCDLERCTLSPPSRIGSNDGPSSRT